MPKIENWSVDDTFRMNNSDVVKAWENSRTGETVWVESWETRSGDTEYQVRANVEPMGDAVEDHVPATASTQQKAIDKANEYKKRHTDTPGGDYPTHIYRVWLNTSTPASGDRREHARYKAYSIDQVIEVVKEEHFDTIPDDLQEEYMGEGRIGLMWYEEPPEDVKEDIDVAEPEGTTYTFEIERDDSADFPMNVITGGTAGRDLT